MELTHLGRTDSVSKTSTHFVCDKKGNITDKFELELELPKFIDEELVELGKKFPFYENFKATRDSSTSNGSRNYSQLCLVGDYLKTSGDLVTLRGIWTKVGTFKKHQSWFSDFDWSEEKMTVSSDLVMFIFIWIYMHYFCLLMSCFTLVLSGTLSVESFARGLERNPTARF